MTEPVIQASQLAIAFDGRRVLSDVTLSVQPGEFVGLVGPNGAGKTTLLRGLLGLVPLAEGTSQICQTSPRRAHRHVGYVPQRHSFAWDFPISVEQVVMTGLVRHLGWFRQARAQDWRRVRSALQRVQMDDLATRTIGDLSGGQKQRVLIARALASQPRVLCLDEPFTGVDVPTQELLTELLLSLAVEGVTVMMTTHDLPAAMASCSRIVLISGGVVADGTPTQLRAPKLWMQTFGVGPGSPLLASLGLPAQASEDIAC